MTHSRELPSEFRAVPADEMAFALAYFVGAANQKVATPNRQEPHAQPGGSHCSFLFAALLQTLSSPSLASPVQREEEGTLEATFRTLYLHYEKSELLVPLCARVLAFCLLMERSDGAALEGWVGPSPDGERYVLIEPVAVRAIASVSLGPTVPLSAEDLRTRISTLEGEADRAGVT